MLEMGAQNIFSIPYCKMRKLLLEIIAKIMIKTPELVEEYKN